jgi:hypothetical protein
MHSMSTSIDSAVAAMNAGWSGVDAAFALSRARRVQQAPPTRAGRLSGIWGARRGIQVRDRTDAEAERVFDGTMGALRRLSAMGGRAHGRS